MTKSVSRKADKERARTLRSANPELAAAMREIRRSSAASPHRDRHAAARAGNNTRGKRAGLTASLRTLTKENY